MPKLSCYHRKISSFLLQYLNSVKQSKIFFFILKYLQTLFLVPIVNQTMCAKVACDKNPCWHKTLSFSIVIEEDRFCTQGKLSANIYPVILLF